MDTISRLESLWHGVSLTGSGALDFAIAVLVVLVAAKLVDLVLARVLGRLARMTSFEGDDQAIEILRRPIVAGALLGGLALALRLLGLVPVVQSVADRLLGSLFLVFLAVAALRMARLGLDTAASRAADGTGLDRQVQPLLENVLKVAVILGYVLAVLALWEVDVTPLVASAGIVGLAVALAAKDTLANFFGGISIYADGTYRIGDYIVLDAGERGEVVEIGVRSTRVKTRDDVLITIPNSVMANSKIINQSAPVVPFRVRLPVGVAYGSDIDQVESLLLETAHGHRLVLNDPAPRVRFRAFGASALDFELLCWVVEPSRRGLVIHDLNSAIYKSFATAGVEIPFPQLDVHVAGAVSPDA